LPAKVLVVELEEIEGDIRGAGCAGLRAKCFKVAVSVRAKGDGLAVD
jgi:hypothetical protein